MSGITKIRSVDEAMFARRELLDIRRAQINRNGTRQERFIEFFGDVILAAGIFKGQREFVARNGFEFRRRPLIVSERPVAQKAAIRSYRQIARQFLNILFATAAIEGAGNKRCNQWLGDFWRYRLSQPMHQVFIIRQIKYRNVCRPPIRHRQIKTIHESRMAHERMIFFAFLGPSDPQLSRQFRRQKQPAPVIQLRNVKDHCVGTGVPSPISRKFNARKPRLRNTKRPPPHRTVIKNQHERVLRTTQSLHRTAMPSRPSRAGSRRDGSS